MPFEKGHKLATGRPKGSKDALTRDAREMFNALFDANIGKLQGWLDDVAGTDKAKALELFFKLSEWVIPKAKTEVEATVKTIVVEPKNET